MMIEHFGGKLEPADHAAVELAFATRFDGWNEYLFSSNAAPYPYLAVLVGGDKACLHYFPEDGHPGFRSVADGPSAEGMTEFRTNTPEEVIEIESAAVVSVAAAKSAAKEFLADTATLPRSIHWVEL